MKRISVLGGTGMAGNVAVNYLSEQGYDVYYTSLDAPDTDKSKALDATDIHGISAWLDAVRPDVIFNCLGVLQKFCDARPDIAVLLNTYLPHSGSIDLINQSANRISVYHVRSKQLIFFYALYA